MAVEYFITKRSKFLHIEIEHLDDLLARLAKRSRLNPETGCIEWTGALMHKGYGHINWRGKVYRTHRLSYAAVNGDIPEGMFVCHKCDNPKCMNPEHLFLGTYADNSADMAQKKRSTIGERNPMAKVNTATVQAIRILGNTGMFQKNIAEKFGISREAVGLILRGERWKHI